jgi:hypothetical protein
MVPIPFMNFNQITQANLCQKYPTYEKFWSANNLEQTLSYYKMN